MNDKTTLWLYVQYTGADVFSSTKRLIINFTGSMTHNYLLQKCFWYFALWDPCPNKFISIRVKGQMK